MLYSAMHPVLVDLPDEVYDAVETAAEQAQMPVKQFVSLQIHKAKLNGFFTTSTEAKAMEKTNIETPRPQVAKQMGDPNIGRLCIQRRVGESVVVDGPAEIVFTGTNGTQGMLAVYAPKSTQVDRDELYDQKTAQAKAAGE